MMKYDKCPNVRIDGDSLLKAPLGINCFASSSSRTLQEQYQNGVYWTLETIVKTWTGWAVLKSIATTHGKKVRIVPFTAADQKDYPDARAISLEDDPEGAAPLGVVPFLGGDDKPETKKWDERFDRADYQGSGQGSDSTIHFDPTRYEHPDAILVHELVHALRQLRGKQNCVPTGKGAIRSFNNEEEFFAYTVSNIYRSEKKYKDLEFGAFVYYTVPPEWKTSEGFLDDFANGRSFARLLDKLNSQCGDLCNYLKINVPRSVPFNPVREYLEHRENYPLVGPRPSSKG
jgi:hypothetical protein